MTRSTLICKMSVHAAFVHERLPATTYAVTATQELCRRVAIHPYSGQMGRYLRPRRLCAYISPPSHSLRMQLTRPLSPQASFYYIRGAFPDSLATSKNTRILFCMRAQVARVWAKLKRRRRIPSRSLNARLLVSPSSPSLAVYGQLYGWRT